MNDAIMFGLAVLVALVTLAAIVFGVVAVFALLEWK
jgi:hypothetical protein